jgi:hypothetical protein
LILIQKYKPTPPGRSPTGAFIFFGAKKTKQKKHPNLSHPTIGCPHMGPRKSSRYKRLILVLVEMAAQQPRLPLSTTRVAPLANHHHKKIPTEADSTRRTDPLQATLTMPAAGAAPSGYSCEQTRVTRLPAGTGGFVFCPLSLKTPNGDKHLRTIPNPLAVPPVSRYLVSSHG